MELNTIEYYFRLGIYKVIIEKRKSFTLEESLKDKIVLLLNHNLSPSRNFYFLLLLYCFDRNSNWEEMLLKEFNKEFNIYLTSENLHTNSSRITPINQSIDGEFGKHRSSRTNPLLEALDLDIDDLKENHSFLWGMMVDEHVDKFMYKYSDNED